MSNRDPYCIANDYPWPERIQDENEAVANARKGFWRMMAGGLAVILMAGAFTVGLAVLS